MATVAESASEGTVNGLRSLELEITGACQLQCTHCFAESSPQGTHGVMTAAEWRRVITDAAALGVREVQLIGGCRGTCCVPRPRCRFKRGLRLVRARWCAGASCFCSAWLARRKP
ncbi:hypothetical protein GCM10023324_08210 [Streptomyces youssoufiensis]